MFRCNVQLSTQQETGTKDSKYKSSFKIYDKKAVRLNVNEILNMKLYQTCVREEEDRDTLCKHRKVVLFCDWGERGWALPLKQCPLGMHR